MRCIAFGEKHKSTVYVLISLGSAYKKSGNIPQAVEYYTKAYNIFLETLGADHKDTLDAKSKLDELK